MRRALLILVVLMLGAPAHAREVWRDDAKGFKMTTVGWFGQDIFRDWLGVKVRMTIPPNGYVVFKTEGSIELHLPCKGWVEDVGIIAVSGCVPNPQTGKDSLQYRDMAVTREMGCNKYDGDVLMVVRIPKMFPTSDCRPDSVRWAGGSYHVED